MSSKAIVQHALDYSLLIASSPGYRKPGVPVPVGYNPKWYSCKCTDTEFGYELRIIDGKPILYFVWPGTESVIDGIWDICAWKRVARLWTPGKAVAYGNKQSPIRVYAGPYRAYRSVRETVLSIAKSCPKDTTVHVSGHSLGAVLAVYCAVDIEYNSNLIPQVFLTGSPRHGNKAFVESYNRRVPETWSFENRKDWALRMPPLSGYYRGGLKVSTPDNGHDIMNYIRAFKKMLLMK